MWKITAGRGNAYVTDFLDNGVVAIGWSEAGDFTGTATKALLLARFAETWPEQTPRQLQVGAGQVWRFLREVEIGDYVLTYDPDGRLYHVGKITAAPEYAPALIERLPVIRRVAWAGAVSRDALSVPTRNTLGAIMTIFKLSGTAALEMLDQLNGRASPAQSASDSVLLASGPAADADRADPFADLANVALERVKDRILSLEWDDMQELVAALLRALGYRTIVAPKGSDRGRDIIASRDGFGFERPRIVVEVKHRKGAMGAPEVRSFLSALHSEDRGLYVSTGGFSKEAHYQAEGAKSVTHLMSLDGLAKALIEQYGQLDERGRKLLPLTRLYWPE